MSTHTSSDKSLIPFLILEMHGNFKKKMAEHMFNDFSRWTSFGYKILDPEGYTNF